MGPVFLYFFHKQGENDCSMQANIEIFLWLFALLHTGRVANWNR